MPQNEHSEEDFDSFVNDMMEQLEIQKTFSIQKVLAKQKNSIKKVITSHPKLAHGFFLSESIQGFVALDNLLESYCMMGTSFHVRPMLEEHFVNPEFIIVNISLYEINVYQADFRHVEIVQHYEFEEFAKLKDLSGSARVFAPEFRGMVPYKNILAIKNIAKKVMDMTLYQSYPVIVTGLDEMKNIFLQYFSHTSGVLSHYPVDFFEKTCQEIQSRCKIFRPAIMDYYSAQLKDRLKKMLKSKHLVSDFPLIVDGILRGEIIHLIIPVETKLWGKIDLETGEFEIVKKMKKKDAYVDILNELAEEVMRQGGRIQFLNPQFFPTESQVLAIRKGNLR